MGNEHVELSKIIVRPEEPGDTKHIRRVVEDAFGRPDEADIVQRVADDGIENVSLVAECEGEIVGHLLFTPAHIEDGSRTLSGMGLAPVAVLTDRQKQGIGKKLIERGLSDLKESGCTFVIVLGHPEYYPKFGFAPASKHAVTCEFEGVPDEAFMLLVLNDETRITGGVARYCSAFH